jgi:lipopolysaccharide/colanic/teichoic acid biosynthesis glycosyltransferase
MKIQLFLKIIFDFFVALVSLVLLSPLFAVTAILIKATSPGPVFFRHERIGKNGKVFTPLKFRTMEKREINDKSDYQLSQDDQRITKVGKVLRKWGIDELPQLVNILKGEMSLVGPRPTFRYQVERYTDFQNKRLQMKPGITGWALVHGRNSLSWEERIEYDVWYVENWSFWLDIKTLFKTIRVILSKQGVYGSDGTNDPFI